MGGFEKLKGMSMESLAEVTARYPWFGVAQKLLCVRLSRLGGDELGTARYAEAAMHVACRRKVLSLLRKDIAAEPHVSGEEVFPSAVASVSAGEDVLYGKPSDGQVPEPEIRHEETGFRGVGDYFSQAQYARVRQKEDDSLRRFVSSDADVHGFLYGDACPDLCGTGLLPAGKGDLFKTYFGISGKKCLLCSPY